MNLSDKPVKSCAIKVHLANLINRKSHVTLVVSESSTGFAIKTLATKKIGMNEQQIISTELFVSVRDSFRTLPNCDEIDSSNFFHVLDADSPGHFVNLRFCEFHLYWREALPQLLSNTANISEFRSRASIEDKLVSVVNTKFSNNGSMRPNNQISRHRVTAGLYPFPTNVPQSSTKHHLLNGMMSNEKRLLNKNDLVPVNGSTNSGESAEVAVRRKGSNAGACNTTSEIKCRPSLSSVKTQILGSNLQNNLINPAKEPHCGDRSKEEVLNSPSSSYSSSSVELKHNLSSSMPVLNKVKAIQPRNGTTLTNGYSIQGGKKLLNRKTIDKIALFDRQCDSISGSEKLLGARRQLPQVTISEEGVEEKRHLLSRQLEKRLIRRATLNETMQKNEKRTLHKAHSLLGWKEKFKSCNEDSDDSRSLASQEVAEIMADAGPMGVVESDYEEPQACDEEEEDKERAVASLGKKNHFLSLFDSMTKDPIEESSDSERKTSKKPATDFGSSSSGRPRPEANQNQSGRQPSPSHHEILATRFQSSESNFILYSRLKQGPEQPLHKRNLTLFDILRLGNLQLFPISVCTVERRSGEIKPRRSLPFRVYSDVVQLTPTSKDLKSRNCKEINKVFAALKVGGRDDGGVDAQAQISLGGKSKEPDYKPGDLLIEVDNVNVLGFSASQFYKFEESALCEHDSISMVVARSLGDS